MSADGPVTIEADEDIFEISDFTVVTQFEGLIASLESILQNTDDWLSEHSADVAHSQFLKRKAEAKSIYYKGHELSLNYFCDSRSAVLANDAEGRNFSSVDGKNLLKHLNPAGHELGIGRFDFCEGSSISKQFGVSSYILISSPRYPIDETNLSTVRSAVEASVINAECDIPVFLQFGDESRELYFGVSKNRNITIDFESAQIRIPLHPHKFLNGLIDVFRQKIGVELSVRSSMRASIQLDFIYHNDSPAPSVVDQHEDVDLDHKDEDEIAKENENDLQNPDIEYPFGTDLNPFWELKLSVCWLNVDASMLNESSDYTELDPLSAPKWFVAASFHDDSKYLLSSMITDLLDCREGSCANCIVFSFAKNSTQISSAANALNPIANSFASNQLNFFSSHGSSSKEEISSSTADRSPSNEAKRYLDECLRKSRNPERSIDNLSNDDNEQYAEDNSYRLAERQLHGVKGAPPNSLASVIAQCLVKLLLRESKIDFEAFALLWRKFVDFLRNSWENCESLPGFAECTDLHLDLSKCLFYQKLQMLEFCIRTKRERHSTLDIKCAKDEDDDSFFDANETFEASTSSPDREPAGRLQVMDPSKFLLNFPDARPIYVPITQDFGPMTEDMVEEHTSYLSSLDGESGERTRAQLDILMSDMQAFKAANPGCVLEDFVRWHSPRDFISEANGGKGELSERMCLEGSIWIETWQNARPLSVAQQSRLFNETKETEAVLQNFERITLRELIDFLFPIVILDSVRILLQKSSQCRPLVMERLMALCKRVSSRSKFSNLDDFYEIRTEIEAIEVLISRYSSLHTLLSTQKPSYKTEEPLEEERLNSFILELLASSKSSSDVARQVETDRVKVVDAPLGALALAIHGCFKPADDVDLINPRIQMPPPYKKQYILRWLVPRPGINSRPMPQRMYASVVEGNSWEQPEFRISGSFASDVTFK